MTTSRGTISKGVNVRVFINPDGEAALEYLDSSDIGMIPCAMVSTEALGV